MSLAQRVDERQRVERAGDHVGVDETHLGSRALILRSAEGASRRTRALRRGQRVEALCLRQMASQDEGGGMGAPSRGSRFEVIQTSFIRRIAS